MTGLKPGFSWVELTALSTVPKPLVFNVNFLRKIFARAQNKKNLSIKPKVKMLDILLSDLVIIVSFNHAIWEPFPFDAFGVRSQSFSSHIILQNFTAVMRMPIRLAGDRSSAPESLLSATIVLRRRSSSSQFSNGDRVKKIWSVYVKNSPVKKALFR